MSTLALGFLLLSQYLRHFLVGFRIGDNNMKNR